MQRQLLSFIGNEAGLSSISSAIKTAKTTDVDKILALAIRTILIASAAAIIRTFVYWLKAKVARDLFPTCYLLCGDTSSPWVMAWLSQDPAAQAQIRNFQLSTTEGSQARRLVSGLRVSRSRGRKVGEHNASWTSEEVIGQVLPTYGQTIRIKHGGSYLWITRRSGGFAEAMINGEHLRIYTLIWQRDALKTFLSAAHTRYFSKLDQELMIFHPEYLGSSWQRPVCRPIRPWSSVILPDNIKDDLLADVESFMSDEEAAWYAERGIPHRRGYLLYGEPGSGKTTLTTAIASKLRLDVYVINPSVRGMDDARLNKLFRDCPSRSIILIEDIDCVFSPPNIATVPTPTVNPTPTAGPTAAEEPDTPSNNIATTPVPATISQRTKAPSTLHPTVTLSGLLNAIDGVSSQEGCILIASTNHPEHLDPALRRPGRFDIQIPFYNATPQQAEALFNHFYPISSVAKLIEKGTITSETDLEALAADFADAIFPATALDKVEEGAAAKMAKGFSMAALQGYLMRYKYDPIAALAGAHTWAEGHYEEKMPRKVVPMVPASTGMIKAKKAEMKVKVAPMTPPGQDVMAPVSAGMDDAV